MKHFQTANNGARIFSPILTNHPKALDNNRLYATGNAPLFPLPTHHHFCLDFRVCLHYRQKKSVKLCD
jgi:hypothetical protein